ncbi:MAG: hypothetical protein AABZ10_09290 [Nitrospirota bacterium]
MCQAHDLSLHEGCLLPLNRQYEALFTTKIPQVYDLAEGQFSGGRDIDLYTDANTGRTYAYVTAGDQGYRIIEVTDPTRPTVVKSFNMSNAGVNWNYRGVDVDQGSSMLAMTEDIRYADSNQYGYVRFYDLTNDPQATPPSGPASPRIAGREKLAEAYTGVPMRISLMNNFAYIATVNIGIQVVDVNAAKEFMLTGKQSDGSTIVGIFDTIGQGYKNPTDIVAYKGGKAAMTTTSGHLILLDINIPQFPQEMAAFKPTPGPNNFNYDSAWRAAVAPEYAYTPSPIAGEGGGEGTNVIDLAVTSSMAGRIHTVDITDPYNPTVMGVAKDDAGNEVIAPATDITISKASGLVYITSGMSVYIIDIKDPNNPKLLNIITATPEAPGSSTMTTLGTSMALVEKDGWVYLANQQQGMRVLDLDPKNIGIEKEDLEAEFKGILTEKDYYPILGTKRLTVYGKINGAPFDQNEKWELRLHHIIVSSPLGTKTIDNFGNYIVNDANGNPEILGSISVGGALDTQGQPKLIDSNRPDLLGFYQNEPGYDRSFAKIYIRWNGTKPLPADMQIELKMQAVKGAELQPDPGHGTATEICEKGECTITVRHNGNVDLSQVIAGAAVFVADGMKSVSESSKQRFDFAKELLNQVVPRKRNLVFNTASPIMPNVIPIPSTHDLYVQDETKYPYHKDNPNAYIDDADGIFEKIADNPKSAMSQALEILRRNFFIGNSKYVDAANNDASHTMRKIFKDYGHNWTNAQKAKYLYQIVDKETLVGTKELIASSTIATVSDGNADVRINGTTGNSRNDTGLYELYKNVVERYVDRLIKEAERYAGLRTDMGPLPTSDWIGRPNGSYPGGVGPEQDPPYVTGSRGMSYSYGGKMSIDEFNDSSAGVSACPAPVVEEMKYGVFLDADNKEQRVPIADAAIPTILGYLYHPPVVDGNYAGNLDDICKVGQGGLKYAGLKWHEYESARGHELIGESDSAVASTSPTELFWFISPRTSFAFPQYTEIYWAGIDCSGLVHRSIESADALVIPGAKNGSCLKCYDIDSQTFIPKYAAGVYDSKVSVKQRVLELSKVRKGELAIYSHHIALVYSDRLSCNDPIKDSKDKDQVPCNYEIIHSNGTETYLPLDENYNPISKRRIFSRKVMKTKKRQDSEAIGFGRIKLWD